MTVAGAAMADQPAHLLGRLRPLLTLLRPYRRMLLLAIANGIVDQGLAIGAAATGAWLVGAAVTGAGPDELRPGLWLLAGLVLPRALAGWLESYVAHDMAFRILVDVRARIYDALERLTPAYLLERRSGDLGAAALGDVETLEVFFAHYLSPLTVACIVPPAALLALGLVHPLLPAVLLPVLVLVATVPTWLRGRAAGQGRRLRARVGEVNAHVVDAIQGLREVVSFGQGRRQLAELDRQGVLLRDAQVAHAKRASAEQAAVDALIAAGMLAVLAAAGALVAAGAVRPALFPAAVILASFAFGPVADATYVARELSVVAAAGERILTLLRARPAVSDRPGARAPGRVHPHVRFERATFRYGPGLPDAVREVTFEIRPGETVALVGHSGAGKSTCAHLLLRFWDVTGGAITVGGHDVRDLPQGALRQLISLVPQDVYLFNQSIADNIRMARPAAGDAEVEQAARAALAHEFITAELPDGYATVVGERGARLSGGQRQRVAIARALLKDAPILVMDEAVSNLDAESERALEAAMARVRSGRTTLVIAHRLSTILAADRVVVLDHGRVAEIGTHRELLARNDVYARLVGAQASG
jgi:ABC-type multidrug transport system fused ATPase/permease subunit